MRLLCLKRGLLLRGLRLVRLATTTDDVDDDDDGNDDDEWMCDWWAGLRTVDARIELSLDFNIILSFGDWTPGNKTLW